MYADRPLPEEVPTNELFWSMYQSLLVSQLQNVMQCCTELAKCIYTKISEYIEYAITLAVICLWLTGEGYYALEWKELMKISQEVGFAPPILVDVLPMVVTDKDIQKTLGKCRRPGTRQLN